MCDCAYEKPDNSVWCSVADGACRGPNSGGSSVKAKCFACGEHVCTACSSKRKYFKYGTKRICNNCQLELLDNRDKDKHVMPRLTKLVLMKETNRVS